MALNSSRPVKVNPTPSRKPIAPKARASLRKTNETYSWFAPNDLKIPISCILSVTVVYIDKNMMKKPIRVATDITVFVKYFSGPKSLLASVIWAINSFISNIG